MPRAAPCPYAASCGGCSYQDLAYSEQLNRKSTKLKHLFNKAIPLHPSPHEFYYRSRMDFIFTQNSTALRVQAKPFEAVAVHACMLMTQNTNTLLSHINSTLPYNKLSSYDLRTHKGFLRYLSIRTTSLNQTMLIFTTNSPSKIEQELFSSYLESLSSLADSVVWLVHETQSDEVTGTTKQVIGQSTITERLCGLDFRVGPFTFFQANHQVAQSMFTVIQDHARGRILDLYCGVGVISLIVGASVGVEQEPSSIAAAQLNAQNNKLTNTTFLASDVHSYLQQARKNKEYFDTIIVDPPRTGLCHKVCSSLQLLKPRTLIYMSCNPNTFHKDAAMLSAYRLQSLEAYDMFPQTPHVELLGVFEPSH